MSYKKHVLIALIFPILVGSFYIVKDPGQIKSDALEYDKLSESILLGEFSIDGKASMEREPGYPFFRAQIKSITKNTNVMLWAQLILYILTICVIGLSIYKIDTKTGFWGLYGASLSYGLAFYPSKHLTETLVGFLLSVIGLVLICSTEKPKLKNWITVAFLSGLLLLTRYTYILAPAASFLLLIIFSLKSKQNSKIILRNFVFSSLLVSSMVLPWMYRNYKTFGEINVAGRSGAILYARSVQMNTSWRAIPDSFLSVFLGRGILFTIYPENQSVWLEQWGDWWRNKLVIREMWGEDPIEIDQKRKTEALKIILDGPESIFKFSLWSAINELRLLELPNPVLSSLGSSFEGTYGPIAKDKSIKKIQIAGLAIVHLIQLAWFILIPTSVYLGFKKYKYRFIPGVFLLCVLAPHFIADNIARYGAPLQPWLLSAIFMTILFPIYNKYVTKNFHHSNNTSL